MHCCYDWSHCSSERFLDYLSLGTKCFRILIVVIHASIFPTTRKKKLPQIFFTSVDQLSLIRNTFATDNAMYVSVLEKKTETKSGVSYERVDCNARENASRRKVVIADQLAGQSVTLGSHMRSAAMSSIPTGTFWYTNMAAVTSWENNL